MDDRNFCSANMKNSMHQCAKTFVLAMILFLLSNTAAFAVDVNWIWSPKKTGIAGTSPQGDCYFRKKFTLIRPDKAELEIAAGDEYEVYINGRLAARGQSYASASKLDATSFLEPGVNLIAARVRHHDGNQVGLAIRFRVKEKGETRYRSLVSDSSWRTRIESVPSWNSTTYNDLGWLKAQAIGTALGKKQEASSRIESQTVTEKLATEISQTPENSDQAVEQTQVPIVSASVVSSEFDASVPTTTLQAVEKEIPDQELGLPVSSLQSMRDTESLNPSQIPIIVVGKDEGEEKSVAESSAKEDEPKQRFEINPEFSVQAVLGPDETGSLIAMEFNEFGKLLLAREGGPLLIADPKKDLDDPERVRVYCDDVKNCQGILALNGEVYVTAEGPDGIGLYVLADKDQDGTLEINRKLAGFTGKGGEHGPHGIQLGPDGMIYVIVGNGSQIQTEVNQTSPYLHYYEGDLIPRYEDPGGHAVGVKAPGGTVVRLSLDGKTVETVAGGIRNAYELVFDHTGEMFIHDSDMESDIGTTWYRPTRVYHVPAGAEMGWRGGSAKFANHFVDQTPAICETGRGSPTGAVLYQHLQFPLRYQDTMFFADWSEGRILSLHTERNGSSFTAKTETFLKGRPLNVCDLAVGEDGSLYFCTGGRGTSGGVYRVVWNGDVPEEMLEFESDLAKVIRHPQPNSAWARQNTAQLRLKMGKSWESSIVGVASEKRNSEKLRLRALSLMVLYGPEPSVELLGELGKDESPEIRAQVARLCGLKAGTDCVELLESLTLDKDGQVRRVAGEAFLRLGGRPTMSTLLTMASSTDRVEAMTARRLLEHAPADLWESAVFSTNNKRQFIQGSVALMTADPTLDRAYQILANGVRFMEGFVDDSDFVDLLRTMELALVRGKVDPSKVPGLNQKIANEFPAGNSVINQELVRIMSYLKVGDLSGRLEEYLNDENVSLEDKVHLGMYMQSVGGSLSSESRMAMVNILEIARTQPEAGGSYKLHLQAAIKQLSANVEDMDLKQVFGNGEKWPTSVIAAFYKLPQKLDSEMVQTIIEMDRRMKQQTSSDAQINQARLGVIAVLAQSGDEASMNYLRELWQDEELRRTDISIGLAQQPNGPNWVYLVSSLPVLDDLTGIEVLEKLRTVPRRPRESRHFKDVIDLGYRLQGERTDAVIRLLEHWSGETLAVGSGTWDSQLGVWQTWYAKKFPDAEKVVVNAESAASSQYSVPELLASVQSGGAANLQRGHELFTKAQCASCHRVGEHGESVGPDLTNLASRFSMREVIESTISPSKVIPNRYASKTILTIDGDQFTGMARLSPDGSYFVLQQDGQRIRVKADDIEEVADSVVSGMPAGLLDDLTEAEVKDLFQYMMQAKQPTAVGRTSQMLQPILEQPTGPSEASVAEVEVPVMR